VPPDVAAANQYREIVPTSTGGEAAVKAGTHAAPLSAAVTQAIAHSHASDKQALTQLASSGPGSPRKTQPPTTSRKSHPTAQTGQRFATRSTASGGGLGLGPLWYVLAALSLVTLGVAAGRLIKR
jgi:hypothetical protein